MGRTGEGQDCEPLTNPVHSNHLPHPPPPAAHHIPLAKYQTITTLVLATCSLFLAFKQSAP